MPLGARLYSIASTRYGDNFDGNTTSLCVRRATYWDEEMGKEDPAKKGICSNFLCDAKKGQKIAMTGVFAFNELKYVLAQTLSTVQGMLAFIERKAGKQCLIDIGCTLCRTYWKGALDARRPQCSYCYGCNRNRYCTLQIILEKNVL